MAKSELTGIGPWRLGQVLGSGERATVYRAHDYSAIGGDAREQALKVLHGILAHDTQAVLAFNERAEAQMRLSRLEHPAIVACHSIGGAGGRPFVVLELVDAVSLDRLFPERGRPKFSLEAATNLVVTLLDALAAAANEKIVHGRLAPNDILVHPDGVVQVTSFGQAGDLRMDFLAVHRIAQQLGAPWPPEVDAWLDALSSERCPWKDARGARSAFPLAPDEAGRKALERAVRNRRRKDQKAAEEAAAAAAEPEEEAEEEVEDPAPRPARSRRAPRAVAPGETEAALREARWVAFSALGIVLVALAMAVFSRA